MPKTALVLLSLNISKSLIPNESGNIEEFLGKRKENARIF